MLASLSLVVLLAGLKTIVATPEILERNLAFRSPYTTQPGLALDTRSIHARHLKARDEIDALVKRQDPAQEAKPSGNNDEYTYSGYGLGIANWDDASYIYAGDLNYTHSIASGDPYDYSVLLWTRAYPTDNYRVDVPMCVEYKVYSGMNATGDVVSCGWALTNADVDFTIKVIIISLP